ncbi:MAG: phospholipase D-like domain-containing protein [Deferribacteraceae bacterium]|jgi:superfamily II DNA/RNA helicase|nr:phospholipase D-like domain-containing protein [Deferribacteraceae bacterium]
MSFNGSFITNEGENNLEARFKRLLIDSQRFDCLSGYFYMSGFHLIYKELEHVDKIRILIGIDSGASVFSHIQRARANEGYIIEGSIRQRIKKTVEEELDAIDEDSSVESGVLKFTEWIASGKLQIKARRDKDIHAKVYIASFKQGDRDVGRVITGSSNFTRSGFSSNLEFNAELTHTDDYRFALEKFEEYWKGAVDVSEQFCEAVRLSYIHPVTPYELYLKFLYEYFKNQLEDVDERIISSRPEGFIAFEYQEQAVLNAKRIVKEYGGVFLSDVVGLGKTYMAAMLCAELGGRTLVIAPPVLITSWNAAISDFKLNGRAHSRGNLKTIIKKSRLFDNIVIDESHYFRSDKTTMYENIAQICNGKRVILLSATPYNNRPGDILNQIKLFQRPICSKIPGLSNLESFFKELDLELKHAPRQNSVAIAKQQGRLMREKVLKHLMVRRTRRDVSKYFNEDLKRNNLKFPKVSKPHPLFYKLNKEENAAFDSTVTAVVHELAYARYALPLYDKFRDNRAEIGAKNMRGFMKALLLKRLESSFYAFKQTIGRFIVSYEKVIEQFNNGFVYISKDHLQKIFDYLDEGRQDEVDELLQSGKAERKPVSDFSEELEHDLVNDLHVLQEIRNLWEEIEKKYHHDPKLETLKQALKSEPALSKNRVLIFTECAESAVYLKENLIKEKALLFYGSLSASVRNEVLANFDAFADEIKNDYRILITTDALSEGVNLHRANVVVNYDIPWNPTRMMQRIGRINRVDTKFDEIHIYNFFPAEEVNEELGLEERAQAKIASFLDLLGDDAATLTEGEAIGSHELFARLNSVEGEDEEEDSELKYLSIIKDVKDNFSELYERIKHIPRKAKSCKRGSENLLISYIRNEQGLHRFFAASSDERRELPFLESAKLFEAGVDEPLLKIPEDYYNLLRANIDAFEDIYSPLAHHPAHSTGGNRSKLRKHIHALLGEFQGDEEKSDFLQKLLKANDNGVIPPATYKAVFTKLKGKQTAQERYNKMKESIPELLLEGEEEMLNPADELNSAQVVLSMYLKE